MHEFLLKRKHLEMESVICYRLCCTGMDTGTDTGTETGTETAKPKIYGYGYGMGTKT